MANSRVWRDFIGYGKETTYGVKAIPTQWARFHGGFSILHKPAQIRLSGTDERRSYVLYVEGNTEVSGSLSDVELLPDHFALLLESALGSEDSGVFKVKNGILPSLSLEVAYGGLYYEFLGVKVQSLSMEFEAGAIIKSNIEFVAQKGQDLTSPTERSYSTQYPFVAREITFTWGGQPIRCQRCSLSIANSLRYPFWELGSKYSAEPSEGRVEITGEFRAIFDSKDEFNDFLSGTQRAIRLTGQNQTGQTLTVDMKNVRLLEFSLDRGEQDWDQTLRYEALYDETDESPITVTIV